MNVPHKQSMLLDTVRAELKLRNDAALADRLGVDRPIISRARLHKVVSDALLLAIHEEDPARFPIKRLKELRDNRVVWNGDNA